jgi:hypothetical protein
MSIWRLVIFPDFTIGDLWDSLSACPFGPAGLRRTRGRRRWRGVAYVENSDGRPPTAEIQGQFPPNTERFLRQVIAERNQLAERCVVAEARCDSFERAQAARLAAPDTRREEG